MKKLCFAFLALLMLCALVSCVQESPEPLVDFEALKAGPRTLVSTEDLNGYVFAVYSDDTAELVSIDEEKFPKALTLPSFYEDYPIVAIGKEVFKDTNFTSVILSSGIERIGDRAFQNSAIESIVIHDGVKELGTDLFENCLRLQKVSFGAGVKNLPTGVCFSCPVLSEVTFSEGLESIGEEAFGDCSALKELALPSTLKEIGPYAFWRASLEKTSVPAGVSSVGIGAFRQTPWLEAKTEEWVLVGDGVLLDYNGTEKDVTLPEEVKYLSDAFQGKSLDRLTLPDTLLAIAPEALEETVVGDVIYNEENEAISAYFKK
ncbi:MAG: leucine-rich repeat domain-containing protein [Clostridia bacterium]|nr:leucine-rich repeat domain-containing protein [Clostridia bacterium]